MHGFYGLCVLQLQSSSLSLHDQLLPKGDSSVPQCVVIHHCRFHGRRSLQVAAVSISKPEIELDVVGCSGVRAGVEIWYTSDPKDERADLNEAAVEVMMIGAGCEGALE